MNKHKIFYIVVAIFWFTLYAYVPYVTPYAEYLGASMRLMGLIAGAYGFTQMAIRFPLGIFSDKIRKRRIFTQIGMGFAALAGFVAFFFPSPVMLLVMRAFGGVAASAWVTFTILGASYYPPEASTKVMGNLSSLNALGRMAALLAGAIVAQFLGIQYAFLLAGIGGIIGLALSLKITENRPAQKSALTLKDLFAVATNKQLLYCSILGILAMYISFATTFGFTPIAAARLYATPFQLGLLGVLSTAPAIVVGPMAGNTIPKKIGPTPTLIIGFIMAAVGSILVAVSHQLWVLFVVQIFASIGVAITTTLLMGLCIRDIAQEKRATAMGFFQAVYGFGMFIGPVATGFIGASLGLMAAFVVTGAIGLVGAVLTAAFGRRSLNM